MRDQFTGWFPADVKPVRIGVYQTRDAEKTVFQMWDGHAWCLMADSVDLAGMWFGYESINSDPTWRGLASPPQNKEEV